MRPLFTITRRARGKVAFGGRRHGNNENDAGESTLHRTMGGDAEGGRLWGRDAQEDLVILAVLASWAGLDTQTGPISATSDHRLGLARAAKRDGNVLCG